jgi:hypothetical protein
MLSALKDLGAELENQFGKDRGAMLLQSWDRTILESISDRQDPSFLEFARNHLTVDEFARHKLWIHQQHTIQQQAMAQFMEQVTQGFEEMKEGFGEMKEGFTEMKDGFRDTRERLIRIEKERVCWCCFL